MSAGTSLRPLTVNSGYASALIREYFGAQAPDEPGHVHELRRELGLGLRRSALAGAAAGALVYEHGEGTVHIDVEVPLPHVAFVVAHELAHHLVRELMQGSRPELRPDTLAPDNLETLCDAIALDLILPPSWVRALELRKDFGLEDVHRLARSNDVARGTLVDSLSRNGHQAGWLRVVRGPDGGWATTANAGRAARLLRLGTVPLLAERPLGYAPIEGPLPMMRKWQVDSFVGGFGLGARAELFCLRIGQEARHRAARY